MFLVYTALVAFACQLDNISCDNFFIMKLLFLKKNYLTRMMK